MSTSAGKPIRLSKHARSRLAQRGGTVAEVEDAIRTSPWRVAQGGRWEAVKTFVYQDVWNGRFYAAKKVRAVFAESPAEIVVVTVYTFFF